MRVKEIQRTPKHKVIHVTENHSVEEALSVLKKSGYRCIPVLDDNMTQFKGLIYKIDLVEYLHEKEGSEKDSIEPLITDRHASIHENASFAESLNIKRLPFLAVLDKTNQFSGILTHNHVMEIIENALGFRSGGYHLTIATQEHKGALKKLTRLLDRYNIEGIFTYDNGDPYLRRIMVTLPYNSPIEDLRHKIEARGFRLTGVEKIGKQ